MFSRLRLQPGKRELRNPFRCNYCQEKKRPFIKELEPKVRAVV